MPSELNNATAWTVKDAVQYLNCKLSQASVDQLVQLYRHSIEESILFDDKTKVIRVTVDSEENIVEEMTLKVFVLHFVTPKIRQTIMNEIFGTGK